MRAKSATARVASRISLSRRSRFSRIALSSTLTVTFQRMRQHAGAASPSRSWRRRSLRGRRRRMPRPWRRRSPSTAPIPRPGGRARGRACRQIRGRPSSPRCAGCWRRAWCRRAGSCRPRCRGICRAPRPGGRRAGDRPGLRSANTASTRSWRAPCSRSWTFRRSAKKDSRSAFTPTLCSFRRRRVVQHEPDDAERRAPQRIGILGAGRLLVDRPEARQHVELVGERHRDRHRIGRHAVAGAERLVVLLDRARDRFILTLSLSIVFAHQALHFGEFADHFGEQIGLGEPRGALGLLDIGADQRRQLRRQSLNALNALGLGAELLVEHDLLELRQPVFKLQLKIGLVEELRVAQARADDALVAGDDRLAAVLGLGVRDQDEAVDELAGLADCAARSISGCCGWWRGSPRRGSRGTPPRTSPSAPPAIRPGRRLRSAAPRPRPARSLARTRGSWRRRGSTACAAPDRARPWPSRASPHSRRSAAP